MPNEFPKAPRMIRKRLERMAAVYRIPLTDEMREGYIEALADLTEREIEIGFIAATKTITSGFPRPAEILACLRAELERMPRKSEADPNCVECAGSGWKTRKMNSNIPGVHSATFAVECPCRAGVKVSANGR